MTLSTPYVHNMANVGIILGLGPQCAYTIHVQPLKAITTNYAFKKFSNAEK